MATPGDLLLVLADAVKRTWKQIIYFNTDASMETNPSATPARIDIPAMEFELDDDLEIISDARGIRIARETGD